MKNDYIQTSFGLVLRKVRLEAGLSQEALAGFAGLDRTYISLLERGLRQPTLSTLIHLASAIGVTPHSLVEQTELEIRARAKC